MSLARWPAGERPRERLLAHGPAALSDAELLALFLGTGVRGKSALDVARELLARFGRVSRVLSAPVGELRAVPGVTGIEPLAARDGAAGFLVEAERDRDVRPDLVRLITSKGWALQELHQVGMSLEEVFMRAVAGEQAPAEPVAEEAR